jgi:hypothetical protein
MYATTRYNFVRLKAMQKISPLEELVGGDLPPSSSQRLTGMHYMKKIVRLATSQWFSAVTPPITVRSIVLSIAQFVIKNRYDLRRLLFIPNTM